MRDLIGIYYGKRVSRSAAELSYFFTMSIFPTLICICSIAGSVLPTEALLHRLFVGVIPTETLETIKDYVNYVSVYSSEAMLVGGAMLMVTSSAAVFRSLHNIMADIQGEPKYVGFRSFIVSFLFSIIFLLAIYFAGFLIVTGEWFLHLIERYITISWAWTWLRFVILFAMLLMLMLGAYALTSPKEVRGSLLPGAIIAAGAMVVVGIIFSEFVSMSVRYSLIYGSLASLIILMLWLYIFGNILILGNAINFLLRKYLKKDT